ncbi:MAG: hypothetical protein J5662_07480, partial [Clostridia bacterium]|nr:hypothetical protein [Clostridia bacterium]
MTDCNNAGSYFDSSGVFHCRITFSDVPSNSNSFYSDYWYGDDTQTRYNNDRTPVWGVFYIGNMLHNDANHGVYNNMADFSDEFIMTDAHLRIVKAKGGSGISAGTDLAPSVENFDDESLYSFVGQNGAGSYTNAHNHPLNMEIGKWSVISTDEETAQSVTVDDDFMTTYGTSGSNSRTYTHHDETDYLYDYYTCSDFGTDVEFIKVGNVYSKINHDDIVKRSLVIKSRAGETNSISDTDNTNNISYVNAFIPINIHKWFSAYDSGVSGTSSTRLTEDDGNFRLKISFKAKRISGTGQPIVSHMYAFGYATQEVNMGAPFAWPNTSWNNDSGSIGEYPADREYITSSYNAQTGEFEAVLRSNAGIYRQTSRKGANEYICIGTAAHNWALLGFDSVALSTSFIISDIKIVPCEYGEGDTELFGGANQAPKMTASNIDTTSTHLFFGSPNYYDSSEIIPKTEYMNNNPSTLNCGMRHAPLNKYSAEGRIS